MLDRSSLNNVHNVTGNIQHFGRNPGGLPGIPRSFLAFDRRLVDLMAYSQVAAKLLRRTLPGSILSGLKYEVSLKMRKRLGIPKV